jgi:replicative DNA helicase
MSATQVSADMRMPPCDSDAERYVVAAMLTHPDAVSAVASIIPRADSRFLYTSQYSMIFEAVLDLAESGQPTDLVHVRNELTRRDRLVAAGGVEHLAELVQHDGWNWRLAEQYAKLVRDKGVLRDIIKAAHDIESAASIPSATPQDTLEAARARMAGVTAQRSYAQTCSITDIRNRPTYASGFPPISTGYNVLDQALRGGFRPQGVYVLAGRTSSAKSTLAGNMAARVARMGNPVLIFKLEESLEEMLWRIDAAAARVPLDALLNGPENADEETRRKLEVGRKLTEELPIQFSDERSLAGIKRVSRAQAGQGCRLVIIDQLSMVRVEDAEIGFERATIASNELRLMARDLNLPVVVVSQVGREASKSKEALTCNSLRDSGEIENDAAGVIVINKARRSDGPHYQGCELMMHMELLIPKNRYGQRFEDPKEPLELVWYPATCRIEDPPEGWEQ